MTVQETQTSYHGMTPQLMDVRERLRAFINEEVIPAEPELEDEGRGGKRIQALKAEAKRKGLWALGHPTEIGGQGVPFMPFCYMNEIIGRSQYGQVAVGSASMQDSIMLHLYASPEQRERWLKPLVAGDIYPSVGLTEPEVAGSDPTLMQTHAHLDGDEWVINGHKWFTSGANVAAFTTVFCKTDPDHQSKHRQFSSIIVPTNTPGYQVVRVVPTMGHSRGGHCEIRLTDVRVPKSNLLGPRGDGFVIAQRRLGPGRIFHCMRWLGQAQRAFELMCNRANTRWAHGSLLAEKGEIQRYIAESAAEIQAARLMTIDAARVIDDGGDARVQIALIKFWGARMLHNVIDRAIQVHGALGVTADTPLEKMYREARYARIYDGPDEVHRMTVARRILRDPVGGVPWA
jgi:alkylation response protein AidB-like acyl-CoA dehydrogenase